MHGLDREDSRSKMRRLTRVSAERVLEWIRSLWDWGWRNVFSAKVGTRWYWALVGQFDVWRVVVGTIWVTVQRVCLWVKQWHGCFGSRGVHAASGSGLWSIPVPGSRFSSSFEHSCLRRCACRGEFAFSDMSS